MEKRKVIQSIVDSAITAFATGLLSGYEFEDNCDYSFVSTAKNNPFTAEFGDEFMFRSPFAHSFVNVLAYMGNCIAKLSYEIRGDNHLYSPQKKRALPD
ncbi:MAG: hypothetical protein LUG95_05455 [Clostridiales bacterium]|nr:hypothetical protein [Clostridiales bacterium]